MTATGRRIGVAQAWGREGALEGPVGPFGGVLDLGDPGRFSGRERAAERVLVTGSREWRDEQVIADALLDVWHDAVQDGAPGIVVVHGACPRGADAMAAAWCAEHGVPAEAHPADWALLGRRAGFVRNAAMVELGASVCLAFIRGGSRGASHTAGLAAAAGIPVRRWSA